MEKAEVSRLVNSFKAIKGYFDTTKKYMPQIAKLVVFIEDVIPLLDAIHDDIHQSTSLIPKATAKLDKVTSATEMAATEVMDIVDNVIEKLNAITEKVETIEEHSSDPDQVKKAAADIRSKVDASQDDLFSIMNALQFQDITTQQINAINHTIDSVQIKLGELLRGFEEDGFELAKVRNFAFDPDAEFDFERSSESQKVADEMIENLKNNSTGTSESKDANDDDNSETDDDEIVYGEDGQPDISAIMNNLKNNDNS